MLPQTIPTRQQRFYAIKSLEQDPDILHQLNFGETEKVDLKVWKRDKEHTEIFVPNTRTKLGREMQEFLNNGLEGSRYDIINDILGLESLRRFTFPFVEIVGKKIILYVDDQYDLNDKDIIEITKREFNELCQWHLP